MFLFKYGRLINFIWRLVMAMPYFNTLNPYMMSNPMAGLGGFPMTGMNPMMGMSPGSIFNCGYDGQFGGLDAYSPDTPLFGGYGFSPMGFGMPYGPYGYDMNQYIDQMGKYSKGMTRLGIETNGVAIDGQKDLMKQSLKAQLQGAGLTNAYNFQYNAPIAKLNKDIGGTYTAAVGNNQEAIVPAIDRAADEIYRQAKQLGDPVTKEQARAMAIDRYQSTTGQSLPEAVAQNGRTDFGFGFWDTYTLGLFGNKKSPSETVAELTGVPESPEQKTWKTVGHVAGGTALLGTGYAAYLAATSNHTPGFFSRLSKPRNWRWYKMLVSKVPR